MANFYPSIDTAANWSSVNRIPLLDEWCLESDTRMVKIGDGSTHYNSLSYSFIPPYINASQVSGTTYTFALTDAGTVVESTGSSACTLTVPNSSSVAWVTGTVMQAFQYGSGQVTLAPASGVTLRYASSLTTRAQYSTLVLRYRGSNEWVVGGDAT